MAIGPAYSFLTNEDPSTIVIVAGSLIIGILFVGLHHFWVTGITSFIGAVLVGSGLSLAPVWWLGFFALGLVAQYTFGRHAPRRYVALPKNLRVKTPDSRLTVNEKGELVETDPLQLAREQLTAGMITAKEFKKIKRKHHPYRDFAS
jgi:membrane protein implicated in regulation of membrane protease activity